jgi:hypothetical protein
MKIKLEKETVSPKFKIGDKVQQKSQINRMDGKISKLVWFEVAEIVVIQCYGGVQIFYDCVCMNASIDNRPRVFTNRGGESDVKYETHIEYVGTVTPGNKDFFRLREDFAVPFDESLLK